MDDESPDIHLQTHLSEIVEEKLLDTLVYVWREKGDRQTKFYAYAIITLAYLVGLSTCKVASDWAWTILP